MSVSASSTGSFAGTAANYLRYRTPYPEALLSQLGVLANARHRATLLDLACGPGRVAVPMAPYFDRVIAVDVEPEMIAVGAAAARRYGVSNITWRVERAETLCLPPRSIDLITIGEAFHRLDPTLVLKSAQKWLLPSGAIATLGGEPPWRGYETWQRVLVDVVNRFTQGALGDPNSVSWGGPIQALSDTGFEVSDHVVSVAQRWRCDSIIGYLFSTSIASRRVLGDRVGVFEAALRAALLAVEPSDVFLRTEQFGATVGRMRS